MADNRKTAFLLGCLLVTAGIICNKWTLQSQFSPDGHIDSLPVILFIALFQVSAIGAGLYLILRKPLVTYKQLALVVFGTIFSLLILEVGSRIWLNYLATEDQMRKYFLYSDLDRKNLRWSPHHYLSYYLTPDYRRGLTSHNSLGYRGRAFSVRKPEGIYRIVAVGGSTTYTGRVDDDEKTFTHQLERILRDDFGYKAVETINAGVGGYNSWESLVNLEFRVLDLEPDLVIIYHGTNDVHTRLVAPNAYRGDNSGRRKIWSDPPTSLMIKHSYLWRIVSRKLNFALLPGFGLRSFVNASTYQGAVSKNPSSQPMKLLDSNLPVFFRRNLTNMIAIARAHDIEVMLSSWAHSPYFEDYASTPHYQRGFKENNEVVREVAVRHGVKFFDFAKKMSVDKKYWADGRHVNEAGALEKAKLFAEFIHESGILNRASVSEHF